MTMSLGILTIAILITICCKRAEMTCENVTYYHRPELDDKTFSQGGLQVKGDSSKAECFSDCFQHPSCNMLLFKPSTSECHLFSTAYSDLTYASASTGFKYYAAGCNHEKTGSTSLPTCPTHYAPLGDLSATPSQCYENNQWMASGRTSYTCKRVEWINTTSSSLYLPSPVVPGLVIDVRGAQKVNEELLCALRQPGISKETVMLRVFTDGRSLVGVYDGSGWPSTIYVNPFPVSAGVVFDVRIVFTSTEYQVTVNGNAYATDTLHNPMNISTYIQMFNWDPLERVKLTYP